MEQCLKTGSLGTLPRLQDELETELELVRSLLEARGLIHPPHSTRSATAGA
jgi:hypothetical protein